MENRDMNLFDFILLCCRAIVRFCKWFGCVVLQTIRLGLQYIWVVLPCAVLGLLGGWLWTRPFATTYEGNATIVYAEGMREVVNEGMVDFLNLPKEEKLSLGVTEEALDAFERMDCYNVIDYNADSVPDFIDRDRSVGLSDTVNVVMRDRIHWEIKMLGYRDFTSFEVALNNYFNSQKYLVEAHKRCKAIQKERLDYFTKEVARLDSFSTYDYFLRPRYLGAEWGNHIISEREQSLYYDAIMVVLEYKNDIEKKYNSTPNVINFQTPFVTYFFVPLYKYAIGLFIGGVLGLVLALCVKYKNEIIAYLKEK